MMAHGKIKQQKKARGKPGGGLPQATSS